ncbi:hypothetical protein ICE98_01981 [Lactococcus lactis]|nr:hypothetical protein [Lactococcus lactis]
MRSIYYFIQLKGYQGSYTTVKRYARLIRESCKHKATIRIETTPGLSAQVDWKENLKLISRNGEVFTINIFLYILGYSRMKYLQLTVDRLQPTLFECLNHAFEKFGGVPEEIWFDNMKTVVDDSKSQFSNVVFNERFRQYAKDAGFKPIACRPFRPQTKGKVEALARTVDRLLVFNNEFEDLEELQALVQQLMEDLNHKEISQAIGTSPSERLDQEALNLKAFDLELLKVYSQLSVPLTRKVSKEALVIFEGRKYSVPVKYIGQTVTCEKEQEDLKVYCDQRLIARHPLSDRPFNYRREDYVEILKSDVFKHLEEDELEAYVDENLQAYDLL